MPQNLLVTGSRGGNSPHVTSAQAANYNAGIVGDGQYVMSGLTATMTSPNICHIDPGVASMNGRDVEVPAGGVDVSVDNGTQAQQRHDLVCLRYTAASEGSPEAVELVCIKGTPAASNAQDPAYNNGSVLDGDSPVDMPLYRVSLDDVSVSEPVKLYDQVPSIDSLRDSVSQKNVLSSQTWDDIAVTAVERSGIVTVTVERWGKSGTAYVPGDSPSTVGQVSAGHRPPRAVRQLLGTQGGTWLLMQVAASGAVQLQQVYGGEGLQWGSFSGALSYPAT